VDYTNEPMNEEPRHIAASLTYDMRAPDFGVPAADLYRAAVEQCAWADRLGFDSVSLLEHHGAVNGVGVAPFEDGFAVKVNLSEPADDLALPTSIEGVPVVWEVVGEIGTR